MDKFHRTLHFDPQIQQTLIRLLGHIDEFKGYWTGLESDGGSRLKGMSESAFLENVGAYASLEGSQMNKSEIQALISHPLPSHMRDREEQEVCGYRDTLEFILQNASTVEINRENIQNLHRQLLKYCPEEEFHRGRYKTSPNVAHMSFSPGDSKVLFDTSPPAEVEQEMDALIEWTQQMNAAISVHPLLITGLFIYEFLAIHPFRDGNTALSRLLTHLLLLHGGYEFIRYISLENLLAREKKEYFESLSAGHRNRDQEAEDISRWMLFFLVSLHALTEDMKAQYESLPVNDGYLNDRQRKVSDFVRRHQPVKLADVVKAFSGVSPHTLKKDLYLLKEQGMIKSAGERKGAVYRIVQN